MSLDLSHTIVIDPGTSSFKCGLATASLPSLVIPTVVGHPPAKRSILKKKSADDSELKVCVGDDALAQVGKLNFTHPMKNGIVENWDDMELILNHAFTTLDEDPEQCSVVLAVPTANPRECTERFAQAFMESFMVEQMAVVPLGLCALYASGRSTGLVLESGDGITTVTPVYEHVPLYAVNRMNFGGSNVTEHLRRILYERGYSFSSVADELAVKQLKETTAFVAEDYKSALENENPETMDFDLPDGQTVEVGRERFRCAEVLFRPGIIGLEHPSMSQFVADCIKGSDVHVRRALSENIVLSGGNTLFDGFATRLQKEVAEQFPGMFGSVAVVDAPDRKYNAWSGASVLASLGSIASYMVTKDLYEEYGPSIIHADKRQQVAAENAASEE